MSEQRTIEKRLWEVNHPYYCNEGNYYAPGREQPVSVHKKGDDHYRNGKLFIFWMGQRKGLYRWSEIEICRADEPAARKWLEARFKHMLKLWEPFHV